MALDIPKEVGIWVRVSTEDQVRGESPEHHERRARAYAEAKGWRVVEVYRLDAVSGKAVMGHAESKRMLSDVRAGKINGLVFSKLARLARNTKELLEFSEIFRKEGADLISLQESIDTSSPAGRLFFTMIAAMAEWEREEITERVRASVPIRAKLGKSLGGAAPFGYRWHEKRLEPDPNEAPVRVLVHELFAEHKRKKTVARILNDRGYRTRRGSRFSDTTLANLLNDPTAKGLHRANYTQTDDRSKTWKLKPESEWVYTEVEPIISADLWDECARISAGQRAGRKPAKRASYLFAGVTYCACGTKMYVRAKSPKYVCEACRNKMPIEDLEAVYRNELHRFLVSPADIEAHGRAANEMIAEKERLVSSTEADIRKIDAEDQINFDLYRAGSITSDAFGRRHHPLETRRAELENELPRLQAELDVLRVTVLSRDEVLSESQNLMVHWDDLSFAVKREIVETITTRIVIGTDDIDIELLQLPIAATSDQKATRAHGRVAFWPLGILVRRRVLKPEAEKDLGEELPQLLRCRRRQLGITQVGAAKLLGVSEFTLGNWETGETSPADRLYPPLIAYLGQEPWPEPVTLPDKLRAERRRRGLGVKEASRLVGVDECTWKWWERGRTPREGVLILERLRLATIS